MLLVFSTSSVGTLWMYSCWKRFLFGFFWWGISIIHLGTFVSSRHLFILIANLSLIDENFFKTIIQIYHYGLFLFSCFWVCLRMNQGVFSLSGLFWVLLTLFPCLFIYSVFLLCSFRSNILLQNYFASFAFSCRYVTCIPHLLAGRIFFRYFEISCFVCILWSSLNIF